MADLTAAALEKLCGVSMHRESPEGGGGPSVYHVCDHRWWVALSQASRQHHGLGYRDLTLPKA